MRRLRGRGPGPHGASMDLEPSEGSRPAGDLDPSTGPTPPDVPAPPSLEPQDRRPDTDAVPEGQGVPQPVESPMLSKTRGSILEFKPPAAAEDVQEANWAFIAALRAGDARAREALVERYLPLVQRLVAGAMGVESDLVDVVQDVFVAVLEGVHKLKDPSALQSWIA